MDLTDYNNEEISKICDTSTYIEHNKDPKVAHNKYIFMLFASRSPI